MKFFCLQAKIMKDFIFFLFLQVKKFKRKYAKKYPKKYNFVFLLVIVVTLFELEIFE